LIEGIDDPIEDDRCLRAWRVFCSEPLDLWKILKLHGKITAVQLPPHARGKWRVVNVSSGGPIAPDWRVVPTLITRWAADRIDAVTHDDIKRAHVAFEKIHPFQDGNGRTGRMIFNWQHCHAGRMPICIRADERQAYYEWFR
jgi:Fic family protein